MVLHGYVVHKSLACACILLKVAAKRKYLGRQVYVYIGRKGGLMLQENEVLYEYLTLS